MIKKLINISSIFKIIISLLIIFSMAKSCAKAYTYTDFVEFVENAYNYNYANNAELLRGIEPFLQNQSVVKNKFGTDLDNGQGYILRTGWNSSDRRYYYEVYLIQLTDNSYRTGASLYKVNYRYVSGYSSPVNPSLSNWYNNTTYSSSGYNRAIFLVSNIDMSGMTLPMGNNFYIGSVKRKTEISSDNDILFDVVVGNHWSISNDSFKLYSGDNYIQDLTISWQQTNNDLLQATLSSSNYLDINTGNNYNLRVFIDNTLRYKSIDYSFIQNVPIIISPGTITNNSGEVTGNINLDEINNNIANLPQNIGNTFYNSGDSGEKGIIQKVYEDLFTISNEEIDNKLQKFIDDNNFDSGEASIAMLGFDYLKNSGDFIISWNNINTPYFKLSGDSINFSAFVRSNDTFSDVMSYVHHILGLSLFLLLGHNMFKTLLATLGISSEIYASNKDDSKPIENVVVTTDSKGNKTQTRTIKYGNITQRWVRKL